MEQQAEMNELHDDNETVTGYDEAGYKNVIDNLAAEDEENNEDFDPMAGEQYQSEAEKEREDEAEALRKQRKLEQARQTVIEALGMYETGVGVGTRTSFVLSDYDKEQAAINLAPAVVKYLPEGFNIKSALFGKYEAEVMGLIGLYMLGKSTIASVKELRRQDAEAKAEAEREKRRASVQANDQTPETDAA